MNTILAIILLCCLDILWITTFMNSRYQVQVKDIQGTNMNVNIPMVICAYTLMIIGLVVFVLPNIRKDHELKDSMMYGFLFGIVLYGVYDFTNHAIFDKWNTKLAIIDILWGGFVYFIVAYISSMC